MIRKIYYDTSDDGQSIIGYHEGCKEVIDKYENVKKIASGAFRNCTSLTSVATPYLTEIESFAFSGCSNLSSLVGFWDCLTYIGKNAFENCTSLTLIRISKSSIKKIEDCVFKGCMNLKIIKIPITVEEIGQNAFYGCTSLTSIEIPSNVTKIGDAAFCGCTSLTSIEIPCSVTKIGSSTFASCSSISKVEIPDSVTEIGWGAFENCSGIINIFVDPDNNNYCDIDGVLYTKDQSELIFVPNKYDKFIVSDKVKVIKEFAFAHCTKLSSIDIPTSVTKIGKCAFANCNSLTSIKIPDSVTIIEEGAFANCTEITKIEVDSVNPNYCNVDGVLYTKNKSKLIFVPNVFDKYIVPNTVKEIEESAFAHCTRLTSIEIPNSVTKIGKCAFANCNSLSSIDIPDSVIEIGTEAFYGCTGLTSIKIPSSVKEIRESVFAHCTSIATVMIPEGVIEIGEHAFSGCTGITSIKIPSTVTKIGEYAFFHCDGVVNLFVDANNPDYCDVDGVLYTKDQSELIFVPKKYKDSNFIVPNSVIMIKKEAFNDCASLTSIGIPDSVTDIEKGAFNGCTSLKELYIKRNQPVDFSLAFENLDISKISLYVPYGSVDSYRSDNKYMGFKEILIKTKQYEYLTLSDDDKVVISCKKDCGGVVIIPNYVTVIGNEAFSSCGSLTSIKIPKNLTEIGENAFNGCFSLEELHLRIKKPLDFSKAFEGLDLSKITLFVPIGSGYDYRHHPFYSKFKEIVIEK